ncbi:MAG: RagB/SusD family nutrient uptake outer membrane protein [Prevotella sp.]|nr:RagB/SusD family nutrient uptake outer membrane protein [Prevotella sp.]MBQ6208207.1 RagB/SusD family nutrient uptake outer membrane protein [Prevotella sp.]
MKRNIFKAFPAIAMMLLLASCSDFFDQESDHVIYADKGHLGNATDTIYSVTGIMNKLQVISDRTILLGEVRGDLMDINDYTPADLRDVARFDIGDNNAYNSPRDYYAVINNCNYFIANADTALKNNRNEYIFMREYAAVKAFRAWTYLQLVLNYGQVPFVTEPILSNADANKDYPMKGIQEVCDYFISDIEKYATIETPRYGTIRSNDSRFFYFPIYILLGDLNLWAGHYKEAALNYYRYLSTRNGTNSAYPISTNSVSWSANDSHWRNTSDGWSYNSFSSETYNNYSELITMIPGDSIPSEGNYSELRNIFNGLNNEDHAMLKPSQYMFDLSAAQPYCYLTVSNDVVYAPQGLDDFQTGDLRLSSVYNKYRVSGSGNVIIISRNSNEDNYYISKYATRNVHIYRRTMVYLRMAEALNRAGYPRFAFEILKNGVNNRQIENEVIPYYTADSTWIRQFDFPNTDYVLRTRGNLTTENTMGIHSHGSGWSSFNEYYVLPDDTLITDSLMRRDYQIEKVEDLIMDEEALEFAFEGYRFYDLMRVALRRNDPSYLANRVYMRRGTDKVDEVKAFIGRDLNDTRNWYLNWNDQIGLGY